MGRGRRPFIDKKKSTTFHLVYRAAEDVNDEREAEERILHPSRGGAPEGARRQGGMDPDCE